MFAPHCRHLSGRDAAVEARNVWEGSWPMGNRRREVDAIVEEVDLLPLQGSKTRSGMRSPLPVTTKRSLESRLAT